MMILVIANISWWPHSKQQVNTSLSRKCLTRMLCYVTLSLPCANNHPSEMRTIILTPSTWQFLHFQDWLINWLEHSSQHLTSTFQTDLIITFLAQTDVRMSMISALEMFHQVTQLDDWTLVLHCYIRQLNNWCNNRHTVFVSTKY